MRNTLNLFVLGMLLSLAGCSSAPQQVRVRQDFDKGWLFVLADPQGAEQQTYEDASWRKLNLPHDWSIEGSFSKDNPSTPGGGALPCGTAWYRKHFKIPATEQGKKVFIDFDGVYMNSTVWINGHKLGTRPYGYVSFRYDLTPYLHYGDEENVVAVRVDNSRQPASRWYSGSGIYRNVWLVMTDPLHIDHWGVYVTTPEITEEKAKVRVETKVVEQGEEKSAFVVENTIYDAGGKKMATVREEGVVGGQASAVVTQELEVSSPALWSDDHPYLYKVVTRVLKGSRVVDDYVTPLGIRSFRFDPDKGFFLNGRHEKLRGVCDHHDLGALGAAVNRRALERQLQILKDMGVNAIRTSHNPPAPELLELCDSMGFLVMDEAFDCWKRAKRPFDYHLFFDEWHERDLSAMVLRDRNHPSVIIWSIGNEIPEQHEPEGAVIGKELAGIVRQLDDTRPITSAMNNPEHENNALARSGACDLIGHNYHINNWEQFHEIFPGGKFIASETTSAIATRGHYDMPSDSVFRWPPRGYWKRVNKIKKEKGEVDYVQLFRETGLMNPDFTCSAYDNCCVPWGSTHEASWKLVKKNDFISGMFIWTGFDYLGEPTPYPWPARSSYFGIIDLAGFPKDAYYLYKSEWTDEDVLHIFPHWNWQEGDTVDVWAYTNCDEVELFLNGASLGTRSKQGDEIYLVWRVPWQAGTLQAVGKRNGKEITDEVKTAGPPAAITLEADRKTIRADGKDLSFITVTITDKEGVPVPDADNLIKFELDGAMTIAGVDNGCQTSMEPFKADHRKAFNGKCLVILQSSGKNGTTTLTAISEGLKTASVEVRER